MYADKFIWLQKVYQRLFRGRRYSETMLMNYSELPGDVKIVMHCPYDDVGKIQRVVRRGKELGAKEYEVNIVGGKPEDIPLVSYGKTVGEFYGKMLSLDDYINYMEFGEGTTILLQFKTAPSRRLIEKLKSRNEDYAKRGIRLHVGSLHWQILEEIYQEWPEMTMFRLNGTPFKDKEIKNWIRIMTKERHKKVSVSYTFWQNCARIPIIGWPISLVVRKAILKTIREGVDAQIAVSERNAAKMLQKYYIPSLQTSLVLYVHTY